MSQKLETQTDCTTAPAWVTMSDTFSDNKTSKYIKQEGNSEIWREGPRDMKKASVQKKIPRTLDVRGSGAGFHWWRIWA